MSWIVSLVLATVLRHRRKLLTVMSIWEILEARSAGIKWWKWRFLNQGEVWSAIIKLLLEVYLYHDRLLNWKIVTDNVCYRCGIGDVWCLKQLTIYFINVLSLLESGIRSWKCFKGTEMLTFSFSKIGWLNEVKKD